MTGRDSANPDVAPRGRDRQPVEAVEAALIAHQATALVDVLEATPVFPPGEAGVLIADVA
jgi:hypothetical protein